MFYDALYCDLSNKRKYKKIKNTGNTIAIFDREHWMNSLFCFQLSERKTTWDNKNIYMSTFVQYLQISSEQNSH